MTQEQHKEQDKKQFTNQADGTIGQNKFPKKEEMEKKIKTLADKEVQENEDASLQDKSYSTDEENIDPTDENLH